MKKRLPRHLIIILITLMACLMGMAGEVLATSCTLKAGTGGQVRYRVKSSASGATYGNWSGYAASHTINTTNGYTVQIQSSVSNGYTWSKWTGYTTGLSSTTAQNPTFAMANGFSGKTITASFTENSLTIGSLVNNLTYTLTTVTSANGSSNVFKVTCSNTSSEFHNKTYCYINHIDTGTSDTGTETIQFNNTATILVKGYIRVQSANATLKLQNGNNSIVTLKKHGREGNFIYSSAGKLQILGNSSKGAPFIIDGGAVFSTAGDARSLYVEEANGFTNHGGNGVLIYATGGALVMKNTILQNNYHFGNASGINSYNTADTYPEFNLENVTIQGCWAQHGSGIYISGADQHGTQADGAILKNVTIQKCYATGTPTSDDPGGGTIRTNGGGRTRLTIDGGEICDNRSGNPKTGGYGGGVYWNACGKPETRITLKNNVKIHDNDALPPNAVATTKSWAGGIMIESRMTIESAEIYNNGAKLGGGIYMCSYGGSAAEFDGKGFDLTVSEGVKIYNNYATEIGGGAYLAINKSPDLGYDPDGNTVDAVFKFTLDGGEVSGNHAPLGGGVAIMDKAPKKVKYCKWRVNHTTTYSDLTLVTSGEYKPQINISSGSIHDNYTDGGDNCGAGIYVRKYKDDDVENGNTLLDANNHTLTTGFTYNQVGGAGTLEFEASGGDIYGNGENDGTVKTANGGAFYITDEMGSVSPYLSECNVKVSGTANIYQNQATTHGGAFFVNNGVFSMTGGTIGGSTTNANKVTDSNSKGGGFYITGAYSNVSISGGSVTYNTATATGGLGGGFYVDNSSSTGTSITGSATVTNNQATSGGGAYINAGTLTVNGSSVEIKSNTATAGNGGGIFANGGTVTLTAGSIANNTATGSGTTGLGGGIYSEGALTIEGATIGGTATTAKNSAYDGAGVYVAGGTVSHTSGSVCFNEASHNGGGIYSTGGTVTIDGADALVADNQAAEQGGGIWAGGTVNLENGLIQRNKTTSTSAGKGGGVYVNNSTFKMTGGTIGGTTTSDANTVPFQGGGVYITGANAKVQVQGGTISYNTATGANGDGGGIYVASTHADGTSVSNSSNITNNTANHDGGGLYVANGKLTVDASTISSNTATNGSGGGVYAVGTVTVTGGTISGNHADKTGDDCGLGGGIYAEAGSNTITIESGSSITGNTAQHGAGLYAASGTVDVKTNSTITSNAASQNGGGIYANGGTVNVSATAATTEILKQNTAVNGGGIYANGGTVNFSNGVIKNNYASHWGGGLYIPATGKLTLKGTATITGNRVPANMHGGGVYLAGVVEVGSASKASTDVLTVEDNYADAASSTVTNDNRNNIYLPNPVATPASSSNPHVDVITIFNTGINTTSSSVGFSVPRNFVPVIYCSDASYLAGLVDSDGVLQGSYIFEDSHKYTAYYHSYAPYDPNHIYLSSGTWVNHVTSQPATGFTVSDGNVTISTEEGLAWLISYVNGLNNVNGGAHDMADKTVTLTADVNMGDYAWVPIGSMLHADAFKGTFDGNGHTISNIYCMYLGDQVTGQNLGMFGAVNGNAVIKDVFLDDAEYTTLNQTTGTPLAGGLVETLGGSAKIYNCGVDAKLESLATGSVIGGLVGKMEGGEIHSAFAVAEMTGYTMGGLVGQLIAGNLYNSFANPQFNYSGPYTDPEDPHTDINLYVGGLVAENGGSVQNCYVRLERNQSLGSALFGMLAGTNTFTIGTTSYNGTIAHSYAPDDASTQFNHSYTYLYNGVTTGLSDCDLYKKVDAPYLYNRPNDNKVGSTDKTLTEKLNEWVSGQHGEHPEYAYWKRTTAGNYTTGSGNINDDYPIHKMVGLSNAASPDGLFIEYKYSLDATLTKYNNLEDGGTVWVYDSPLSAMTASGGTPSYESVSVNNAAKVKLYIDEDVSLLQTDDTKDIAAYTCQTLKSYTRGERWHYFSSSLSNSGIGFNYGTMAQVPFSWAENPCNVTFSTADDQALFPSDMPHINKVDLYCFYEPEYHWLNLKRNTASHWHMNAPTVPIAYIGNGTGSDGNETSLVPGKGYLVSIDQEQLVQNRGTLNNGDVTLYDVTKTDFNAWAGLLGYNLLGNPYQSYLDIEKFMAENTALWGGSKDEASVHTYAVYDPETDCYLQYKRGVSRGARATSGLLNPHQGFLIRKTTTDSGTNTQVKFTNAMRSNNGTPSFREPQPAYPLVNVILTDSQGRHDLVVLELGRDADEGVEKLRVGECSGRIGLALGSESYAILFRDETAEQQALRFEAEEEGEFTLRWETANAEFESLTLVDNIEGSTTDMLSRDSYSFEGSPDQYASRFRIVIGEYKGIEEPEVPEPVEGPTCSFAYQTGDQLVVEGEGTLEVVDMLGHVVMTERLSDGQSRVRVPQTAGVYLLRLTGKNGTRTQKIVTK